MSKVSHKLKIYIHFKANDPEPMGNSHAFKFCEQHTKKNNKRVLNTRFDCIALQDSEPDGCQAVQLAIAPAGNTQNNSCNS